MSNPHGKDASFWLNNKSGSITDYSATISKVTWKPSATNPDSTTLGSKAKKRQKGLTDASFTVEGFVDLSSGGLAEALYWARGVATAFRVGPEGNATSKKRFTGSAILRSWNLKPNVTGVVPFTAQFDVTGAYTKDTF